MKFSFFKNTFLGGLNSQGYYITISPFVGDFILASSKEGSVIVAGKAGCGSVKLLTSGQSREQRKSAHIP